MAGAYGQILLSAVLFSAQFIFSKLYQRKSDGSLAAHVWMVVLQGAWIWLLFFAANGFALRVTPPAALFALAYAAGGLCNTVASIRAVSMGKLVTVTLYSMIGGQAVPFLYGLFTGAHPTALEVLGFVLVLAASLPAARASGKKTTAGERRPLFLLLCMVVFWGNGLVSVFSDVNAKSPRGVPARDFLLLCAVWMLALGGLLLTAVWLRGKTRGTQQSAQRPGDRAGRPALLLVGLVGGYTALNGLGNICSLQAARTPGMYASVQFPLLNAAIMLLTTLWGRLFFKERIERRDAVSLALLVGGILLFMVSFWVYGS